MAIALASIVTGLLGVALGGLLARRNQRRAHGERLLVEALNDAVTAIAEVAGGVGRDAQARYASAISRIGLHASPSVVAHFRDFQEDADTGTADGRARLIAAIQAARQELGHSRVEDSDLAVLLFGSEPSTDRRLVARCYTPVTGLDFSEAIRWPRKGIIPEAELGD